MKNILFPLLALMVVLVPAHSFGQTPTAAPSAVRPLHMTFYYWQDIADDKFPDRPIQMSIIHDSKTGHELYTFLDQRTQKRFRDGAQIKADMAGLTAKPLMTQTRARVRQLKQEQKRWNLFLQHSPVILTEADLEPQAHAEVVRPASYFAVSLVFTAQGTRKFSQFTTAHVGEINGVVVENSILSAPIIMEPILGGQAQISGGFKNLSEAKSLADGLNASARQHWKP